MIRLVNFYKSSSGRQEKTRPVAILSTTLQPYFRFHLNATCAVCAGPHRQVDRGKERAWNDFGRFFPDGCLPADVPEIVSVVSEPFLGRGGVISLFWRIRQEGEGKGRTGAMYGLSFLTLNFPQKSKCDGQYRGTPVSCVVITRIRRLLPFRSPPTPVLNQKLRASARKTSPLELLHGQTRKPFSLRIVETDGSAKKTPLMSYGKTPPSEGAAGLSFLSS